MLNYLQNTSWSSAEIGVKGQESGTRNPGTVFHINTSFRKDKAEQIHGRQMGLSGTYFSSHRRCQQAKEQEAWSSALSPSESDFQQY